MTQARATITEPDGRIWEAVREVDQEGVFWMPALSGWSRVCNGPTTTTTEFGHMPLVSSTTVELADWRLKLRYPRAEIYGT